MAHPNKPPIGIKPARFHDADRIINLMHAIHRQMEYCHDTSFKNLPRCVDEWAQEIKWRLQYLRKHG